MMLVASVLFAGVLLPYVGGIGLVARQQSDRFLDTTCDLQETAPPEGTTFYANDGKTIIATIFEQNRKPVALAQMPVFLQKALIDTEDRRFYQHHGVDMRGLLRSAFSTSGGDTQGGSTLTMQYVKQSRYYRDIGDDAKQTADISQNIGRKLQDAKCAIDLEKRESKDQILENYLNIAFFGENAYSIESAAETYFGTTVDKLTLPQAAMMVGVLRAPTDYDPFQHPQAARERRNQVIENMVTAGDITADQAKTYEATPVTLSTPTPPTVEQGCYNAPSTVQNVGFFCDYVQTWLQNVEGISNTDIKTGGLKVVTTLDANLQNSSQAALTAKFPAAGPTTALMPAVDPATGNVLAMVSSKQYGLAADGAHISDKIFTDYNARGASTYKYFSMVAALEAGAQPSLQISANTVNKKDYLTQRCLNSFTATNGDQAISYAQTETMQTAIAKSSNTYFVGLVDGLFGCDLSPVLDTMKSLGMKNMDQKDPDDSTGKRTYAQTIVQSGTPIVTLGEYPTSPLELTGAYAAAANDGNYCTPAPVISIADKTGKAIAVKRTPCTQVMTPQVARTAVSLLTGDTQAGGTSANIFRTGWYNGANKSLIAGKTGTDVSGPATKQLNSSFWFVGVTPKVVSTMALINVSNPTAPLTAVPGVADAAAQTTADGSVAANFWLNSMAPSLTPAKWNFPSAGSVSGSTTVPNIVGMSQAVATSTLVAKGYKAAVFSVQCGAAAQSSTVGYYSPVAAAPGTTVTMCISNGSKPFLYTPPAPKPTPTTPTPGVTAPVVPVVPPVTPH
jgi:membrane peptidoglycan carboxypeptidase